MKFILRRSIKNSKIENRFSYSTTETIFYAHGSVHRNSMLIKFQPDATECRYLFTAKALYMFRVSQHPSSGVLKTVTAASGTGHNIGTATSLQRGPIGPRWREVAVPVL
jgi:hypothetical protein